MTARRCIGALLAGGAARRFNGAPKGLALVDGVRIADRALAALANATDEQIVVANDPRAASWFPGLRIVADDVSGLGPLAGLRSALQTAQDADGVIVVAWDMPFVTSALLRALRTIGERGASAVVSMADAGGPTSPLCAYYGTDALEVCERLLAQGERRASALAESLVGASTLTGAALAALGDPARLLRSIDSPEELAALGGQQP